jgi:hypothetical protein
MVIYRYGHGMRMPRYSVQVIQPLENQRMKSAENQVW